MIHDNFDGSNWCVECDGPCKLTGAERTATNLVRRMFEMAEARGQKSFDICTEACLKEAGVDIAYFFVRAQETRITKQRPLIERRARPA